MRRRPYSLLAVVMCAALLGAACGSFHSEDEIATAAGAARGGGSQLQTSTGGSGQTATTLQGSGAGTGALTPGGTSTGGGPAGSGSSGGSTSGGGGGQSGGTDGSGVADGSVVRIGVVGALGGPAGAVLRFLPEGVQVWAQYINSRGGVNGHPVEVLIGDDGGDSARHRQIMQEFIEQRGVIAFVANPDALSAPGSIDYITQVRVPVIGSEGAGEFFYQNAMFFPQVPHGTELVKTVVWGAARPLIQQGKTKFAVLACVEVQTCEDAANIYPELISRVGGEVVYIGRTSLATPDFTSFCLNAQSQGAQAWLVGLDANSMSRLLTSCARQGFRAPVGINQPTINNGILGDANFEGSIVGGVGAPWFTRDTPALAEFQDAYATFAPGVAPNPTSIMGWIAAKVFEKAAENLPAEPTSADVLEGLWSIQEFDVGGLTYPLTYVREQPAPRVLCYWTIHVEGGQFVSKDGSSRQCGET